jgi:hypothetical protein
MVYMLFVVLEPRKLASLEYTEASKLNSS